MNDVEKLCYIDEVVRNNPTISRIQLDQTGTSLYALATGAVPPGAPDLAATGVAIEACPHNDNVSRGYASSGVLVLQFTL